MTSPTVWAGPILRRMLPNQITIWLATSTAITAEIHLFAGTTRVYSVPASRLQDGHQQIKVGENFYLQLLDIKLDVTLPFQEIIYYDLTLNNTSWQEWAPDLAFAGHDYPFFVLQPRLTQLLHGSCRKPHHPSQDGLLRVEQLLASTEPNTWPALLMLSGDQIYTDDVATPMLQAIHQLIPHLAMTDEVLPCIKLTSANALHQASNYYQQREHLLPDDPVSSTMLSNVFAGAKKPIFTSDNAHNHLISLAEILGMYLLVWSPVGWQQIAAAGRREAPAHFTPEQQDSYNRQAATIDSFANTLPKVRRVLAHLPTAMIFDDHDVTDDWNLTAAWELAAYQHPFSKRIIGNALLGYLLCQGWGNAPEQFDSALMRSIQQQLVKPGSTDYDTLLDQLLCFDQWQYQWPTQPPLLVLDTRTQRWRSEQHLNNPSGLMDWESLTALQQKLLGLEAVVLVSAAPIFGVKLIEATQRIFTWLGKPLLVDAENWMAHRGTAYTLMNMFRHPKTPKHFVILSGDVHYSFVYEVRLRGRSSGPHVWQITSSGIKNQFPKRLLDIFDRLNRWLYSPRSPLNWFTRRRRMQVIPHKPETADAGERLLNAAGIGLVRLNPDGSPAEVIQLCVDGSDIRFHPKEEEGRWH
ncbi:alkaline phosphatase family protein [Alishewanella sp. d11]|uniref:alkaline phosphatase family protein n=1 Tax=Alishewanella sp. d11 TaxID=3414030 RepID=UPI003BF90612